MANGDGGTGEIFMPVLKALQPIVEPWQCLPRSVHRKYRHEQRSNGNILA
jgi:hypothetical protein